MRTCPKSFFSCQIESCERPIADLYETDEHFVVEVELPGIEPSHISLRVYEDLLVIEGVRMEALDESGSGMVRFLCVERGMQSFRRILKIPIQVDTVGGRAFYRNGVLTVTFPKLKGKVIKIPIEHR
jgi:HSP20 family protein